jgi:hypothetical protein
MKLASVHRGNTNDKMVKLQGKPVEVVLEEPVLLNEKYFAFV